MTKDSIGEDIKPITAAMLYDLVACPHRVTMDLYGDPKVKDEVSPFLRLLWERGALYEQEVMSEGGLPALDLSRFAGEEKEQQTIEAMKRGEPLIYSGRIRADDLLGEPDLLRKEGGGYIAIDIKSGAGEEGSDENAKPKKKYAVQLCLYTDILERLGYSAGRRGFIWDIHGKEVPYDFMEPYGVRPPRQLWDEYELCLAQARSIVANKLATLPAYASGTCKNCPWYTACLKQLSAADDLTLIPELGRAKRDVLMAELPTTHSLAECDLDRFTVGDKTVFPGIGAATLSHFKRRARLVSGIESGPYLREPVALPLAEREIFFDIEVDPMRDTCYLHGFIERRSGDNTTEHFVPFFISEVTEEAEEEAFASAWRYIQSSQPCVMYFYSKYERTIYRKLQQKYPHVCSEAEVEALFDPAHAVDLYYDVVLKATEWPTRDYSIKTLAKYLGFSWRDTHPSGAASIEWFDRWVKTADPVVRQRILDYNEDDCRAMRVLLDGIRGLRVVTSEEVPHVPVPDRTGELTIG